MNLCFAREVATGVDAQSHGSARIFSPVAAWTDLVLLKVSGFLVARATHSHGMVPAARWDGTPVGGAAVADALSAGPAVMDGQTGVKLSLALIAATDVLVGNPVRRPRRVFYQAW